MPVHLVAVAVALPNARTAFMVLVALACLGVAAVALAARLIFPDHAPQPAGPTTGLGSEPPAVVNLLVNDLQLTDDAATAVLLDLACQRIVEFVDFGDGDEVLFLRQPNAAGSRADEKQVLDFVRGLPRLHDGVPLVAVRAATADDGWWDRFRAAVRLDAHQRGLVSARYPVRLVWAVQAGLAGCVVLGVLGLGDSDNPRPSDPSGWAVLSVVIAAGLAFLALRRVDRQALRFTALGSQQAARWLGSRRGHDESGSFTDVPPAGVAVWGGHLVAATAMGVAREASQRLQLAVGDGSSVWYVADARWAHARVRHPDAPWGSSPASQLRAGLGPATYGLVVLGMIGFVTTRVWGSADADQRSRAYSGVREWLAERVRASGSLSWQAIGPLLGVLVGAVVFIAFLTLLLSAVLRWAAAFADLFLRRVERGWVAARRGDWIVVGDGSSDTLVAYRGPSSLLDQAAVGERVELVATRFLGHVRTVRRMSGPPGAPY